MKILKWGLIGCGDIVMRRVGPALQSLSSCELIAVSRADASRAAECAKQFDAPRSYEHWQDLVADPEIEAVYIATPVFLHEEQTLACAKAGKHVLCEKPMALSTAECDRMIQACEQAHVKLSIAYYRHFYPVLQRVQALLASDAIGKPTLIQVHAFDWFDAEPGGFRSWLLEKDKAGGGPLMDFGCHRLEVLLHLFGPVSEVIGTHDRLHFTREVEDTAVAILKFESGPMAVLSVTHATPTSRDTVEIYGTKGSLHIPALNAGTLHLVRDGKTETEHHPPHENLHLPHIEAFTQAVLNDTAAPVDGDAGRAVNQIMASIYQDA